MNERTLYHDYCTGCGLCMEGAQVKFGEEEGFDYPILETEAQIDFCRKVCPANAAAFNKNREYSLWGDYRAVYKGWSLDREIRYKAASGGVITAICVYLLKTKQVDYVLHVGEKIDSPLAVQLYCHDNEEDVIRFCASRYITGISYGDLYRYLKEGKSYAIVGKPCDIEALTNLIKLDSLLKECIKYRFTFFCAGAPSRNASIKLAEHFGAGLNQIKRITYRGNGWPGLTAVAVKGETKSFTMDYIDSWNNILGRDVRKMCKFCINGIGEAADISCGDLWKLDENKKPVFIESQGQNIIFARTESGHDLLKEISGNGYLHIEPYTKLSELSYIQSNHSMKRATMYGKITGLKLVGREVPLYRCSGLKQLAKDTGLVKICRTACGTIKRAMKGTI